jgi:PP-loop superfamily ATP-utilizing enzyme
MKRFMEPEIRERIVAKLKELGFLYVTLDLEGYVTGSMNRGIEVPKVVREDRIQETEDRRESK